MAAPPDPRLQLQPAPLRASLWLAALAVGLPLVAVAGVMVLEGSQYPEGAAWGMAICGLAFIAIEYAMRRHRLSLDAGVLVVATTFYTRRVALADLQLDKARVVDLAERIEFKPLLRANGVGLPGFTSGWMMLRNRDRAFVALSGGTRVLWLPTTHGFGLLLQPVQPRALLDHLREVATAHDG